MHVHINIDITFKHKKIKKHFYILNFTSSDAIYENFSYFYKYLMRFSKIVYKTLKIPWKN